MSKSNKNDQYKELQEEKHEHQESIRTIISEVAHLLDQISAEEILEEDGWQKVYDNCDSFYDIIRDIEQLDINMRKIRERK